MTRKYNCKHPDRNKNRKHGYANKLVGRQIKRNTDQKKVYQSGGSNK